MNVKLVTICDWWWITNHYTVILLFNLTITKYWNLMMTTNSYTELNLLNWKKWYYNSYTLDFGGVEEGIENFYDLMTNCTVVSLFWMIGIGSDQKSHCFPFWKNGYSLQSKLSFFFSYGRIGRYVFQSNCYCFPFSEIGIGSD